MGHEYIHAAFFSIGYLEADKQEAVAYAWSKEQAYKWGYSSPEYANGILK